MTCLYRSYRKITDILLSRALKKKLERNEIDEG